MVIFHGYVRHNQMAFISLFHLGYAETSHPRLVPGVDLRLAARRQCDSPMCPTTTPLVSYDTWFYDVLNILGILIKGSLGGETSVLRTFRMSGKELVKERVSKERVRQGKS